MRDLLVLSLLLFSQGKPPANGLETVVPHVPTAVTLPGDMVGPAWVATEELTRMLRRNGSKANVRQYTLLLGRKGELVYVRFSKPKKPFLFGMGPDMENYTIVVDKRMRIVQRIVST